MGVKNISVLIGESESHILKSMKMKIISWVIYMIMDYQFLVMNHLLNNIFKYINILTLC
jgi:hypothetical protein